MGANEQIDPASPTRGPTRRELLYASLLLLLGSIVLITMGLGYSNWTGGARASQGKVLAACGVAILMLSALVLVQAERLASRASVPGGELRKKHRWAASRFGESARVIWQRLVEDTAPIGIRALFGALAVLAIVGVWLALVVYWVLVLIAAGLVAGVLGPFQSVPK